MHFNPYKAAEYALTYANYTYDENNYASEKSTPEFPLPLSSSTDLYARLKNDCTNFVCQALYKGGWTMTSSTPLTTDPLLTAKMGNLTMDHPSSTRHWFYRNGGFSDSWVAAPAFAAFVNYSNRGRKVFFGRLNKKMVLTLQIGDVMQQSRTNDINNVSHTAIVTKTGASGGVSQHSGSAPFRDFNYLLTETSNDYWVVWRMFTVFT